MKGYITISNKKIIVLAFILCGIIVFINTLTPRSVNTSLLYLIVSFLSLLSRDIKIAIYFGFITSILTVLGLTISIPDGNIAAALVNRVLVFIAIWVTIFIGWRYKFVQEKLWVLAAMVESAEEAIVGKTIKGIVLNWNKGAQLLYGFSADDMVGKSIRKIIPEGKEKEEEDILNRIVQGECLENYETVRRRKDGHMIYVSLTISPIKDFAGNIIGASTITRDITRIKSLELKKEKYQQELEKDIQRFKEEKQRLTESYFQMEQELKKKENQLHSVLKEAGRKEEQLESVEKTKMELESEVQKKNKELWTRNVQLEKEVKDRARIEQELRESTQRLRELSAYLHNVREQERSSLARDVHDHLGQLLTAIKMDLSWVERNMSAGGERIVERVKETGKLINDTISSVQRIVSQLRPSILDDMGIIEAIKWQAKEFQKRSSINCYVNISSEDMKIAPDASTALFRIFQESLTNIVRHAQATEVYIEVKKIDKFLCLQIKDNGIGLPNNKLNDSKSFGLIGMRERVALFKGHIDISAESGHGTVVKITIPLNDAIIQEVSA